MSLHSPHHVYHFFHNKEMNHLYLSYGLLNFALGLISVFVPIYLYQSGYSIPEVLFYFFLVSISFIIFSIPGVKVVSKLGVKHTMLLAMPILMVYFLGLKILPEWSLLFFILPILKSFKMILYNYSFHLNFIEHSDGKNRGKEVSMIQASALIASALSPLFGGIIIKLFSFSILFIIGSILLLVAMVPLFLTRDTYEKITFDTKNVFSDIFKKENLPLFSSFAGYAVESWIGFIVWPIFLFIILMNTESVGAVTSLTTIITLLVLYFMARETDKKDKRKLLNIGTILYFFGWLGRIFVQGFISIFFVDIYKNISQYILHIPWSAYSYDLAAKRNYFKFIVNREIIFNLTRSIIIPFIILIFIINFHPFIISFSLAALFSLLYVAINKDGADLKISK